MAWDMLHVIKHKLFENGHLLRFLNKPLPIQWRGGENLRRRWSSQIRASSEKWYFSHFCVSFPLATLKLNNVLEHIFVWSKRKISVFHCPHYWPCTVRIFPIPETRMSFQILNPNSAQDLKTGGWWYKTAWFRAWKLYHSVMALHFPNQDIAHVLWDLGTFLNETKSVCGGTSGC